MINPLFKKKEKIIQSGFNFADIVMLVCFIKGTILEYTTFSAKIMGKVKNANAYVVSVFNLNKLDPNDKLDTRLCRCKGLKKKFGYPIRQIELEWGKFSGSMVEFIVPEYELKKSG